LLLWDFWHCGCVEVGQLLAIKTSVGSSSELIDRRLMIQLTGWTEVLYTCH
jgi:hypothetical protein